MSSNQNEWVDKERVFGWDPKSKSCYELHNETRRRSLGLIAESLAEGREKVAILIRGGGRT